ncbi:hypothetical protein [Streptomyces rectiverticillatus]|uniref:hypothetical protein n=1 Tax=Streptomyces rectiverticillatus TaxID=173860 RepID=UPI001FE3197F|nr:hypothetical protein [Streptomyces rectiverticillatus]
MNRFGKRRAVVFTATAAAVAAGVGIAFAVVPGDGGEGGGGAGRGSGRQGTAVSGAARTATYGSRSSRRSCPTGGAAPPAR